MSKKTKKIVKKYKIIKISKEELIEEIENFQQCVPEIYFGDNILHNYELRLEHAEGIFKNVLDYLEYNNE
jgi:hypothetical protein